MNTSDLYRPLGGHDTIRAIGGSDIQRIVKGDWHRLWLEKRGLAAPEDLRWKLPVQIGRALEPVILDFYAHEQRAELTTGQPMAMLLERTSFVMPDGRCTFVHPIFPWAIGSPDGLATWGDGLGPIRGVEAKTTNYWSATKEAEKFVRRCAVQMTWYMEVTGCKAWDLVWLVDNSKIEIRTLEYDTEFATDLLGMAEEFWWHVVDDTEPTRGKDAAPLIPAPKFTSTKTYNMSTRKEANAWTAAAADYMQHRGPAALFEKACTDLKGLMPEDAKEAFGAGIKLTRDRANRVTIRPINEE